MSVLPGTNSAITPDGPYACREHWEIERVPSGEFQRSQLKFALAAAVRARA